MGKTKKQTRAPKPRRRGQITANASPPSSPPPDASPCRRSERWNSRLAELKDFYEAHGHANPPAGSGPYRHLHQWCVRQREQLERVRNNRPTTLTGEQVYELMEVGLDGDNGPSSGDDEVAGNNNDRAAAGTERKEGSRKNDGGSSSGGRQAGSAPSPARNKIPTHRLIPKDAIVRTTDLPSKKRKREYSCKGESSVASHRVAKRLAPSSISVGSRIAGNGKSYVLNDDSSSMSLRDQKWYAKFAELKEWKAKHGTIHVPSGERPLYGWQLRMQRLLALHRAGRSTPLKLEWANELEALGLGEGMYAAIGASGRKGADSAEPVDDGEGDDDDDDTETWEERLKDLQQYKKQHGTCAVPFPYHLDPGLGKWTERQRAKYSACRECKEALSLTSMQIDALDMSDFASDNSVPCIPEADKVWHRDFEAMKAYHSVHGTVNVKARKEGGWEDERLRQFVKSQRTKMSCLKNGIPSTIKDGWIHMLFAMDKDFFLPEKKNLTDEQVADLRAVLSSNEGSRAKRRNDNRTKNTIKSGDSRRKQIWREKLEELRRFKEENGHCEVTIEDDRELFYWLLGQKEQLKLPVESGLALRLAQKRTKGEESERNGNCDEDRTGGAVSVREKKWFLKLKELEAFKAEHGHIRVTAQQDRKLYHWLLRQKEKMQLDQDGGLSGMKENWISALKKIGVGPIKKSVGGDGPNVPKCAASGSKREWNWYKNLDELQRFKAEHGSTDVTSQVNKSLRSWCKRQKEQLVLARQGKPSSLNASWVEELESLGM